MVRSFRKSLAAAAATFALGCSAQPDAAPPATMAGSIHTAATREVAQTIAVAGTVRAATVSPLASRVMGDVVAVHVSEGDRVRAGQILLEIDEREASSNLARAVSGREEADRGLDAAEAALDAAEAQARVASATFQRFAALRERGSASAQEFDEMKARNEAAQAHVEAARQTRDRMTAAARGAAAGADQARTLAGYAQIRAPIDGIISARFVDPGAQAAPGMPLLVVEGGGGFRVEANVDETVDAKPGDRASVEIAGRRIPTRVSQRVSAVDPGTRTSLLKLELPGIIDAGSGSYARVLLRTGTRRALMIPADAVMQRGQLSTVFVISAEGKAQLRLVTLGERADGDVEILSGLAAGERFVTGNLSALREGVIVTGAS